MSKTLKKIALVLCLSVSLSSHTARAGYRDTVLYLGGEALVSSIVFGLSVVGIVFSVLPAYGALYQTREETTCYEKQVVCLDNYICNPRGAFPCYKVAWIGSYHFVNTTNDCDISKVFCVAHRDPVIPITVSSPFHRTWLAKDWANTVFSASCVIALVSGLYTLASSCTTGMRMQEWYQESESSSSIGEITGRNGYGSVVSKEMDSESDDTVVSWWELELK